MFALTDCAQVFIRLYQITGEEKYRKRAEKIFLFMKSRFQYFDNHYVWNYWEPFGPWDIDWKNKDTRHWVGVHPYRNYQAGEVNQIVDAYHHGIVFDEVDIQRIINTNLKVMWNGDRENPKFANSNVTHVPSKKKPTGDSRWKGLAGILWSGLIDFDPTIRELYELKFKGQKEFLMAAREVFKKVANCRAFIVGDHSDGPLEYYNELKSMIRDYSLTKKVILTGYRQDALEIMKCMDVVVLATRVPIEAFGRVIIEAMSLGKPVVATKCGGPADIIENGKNGYLIPMRDIKAMSNAIIKLLTEENIDNFKQAAKETVIKKFSAKVCIPKIDKIYRTLMNIKRQSKQVSH